MRTFSAAALWVLFLRPAGAHIDAPDAEAPSLAWAYEPWVFACLAIAAALYALGAWKLWHKAGVGRGLTLGDAAAFVAGCFTLFVALVSPLDALGGKLFSAHMVQHELLMIVAAPLLVLSRPFGVWLWALPLQWRQMLGQAVRLPVLRVPWRFFSLPLIAWLVHALALWLWHVPAWFDAALADNAIHTLQHLSFLLTALFFWWALLDEQAQAPGNGVAMLYLFTTMIHTGALGALMTFSAAPWYVGYHERSLLFGLSPLEDQQLGGLIMWIPGGLVYLIAGLALGARWIGLGQVETGRRL